MKIIVYEPEQVTRRLLSLILGKLGHRVDFPNPKVCPLYTGNSKNCPQRKPCADVMISNHHMPDMEATEFFDRQQHCGCKMLEANKVILNGDLVDNRRKAKISIRDGYDYLSMPLELKELRMFLTGCELRTRKERYWLH